MTFVILLDYARRVAVTISASSYVFRKSKHKTHDFWSYDKGKRIKRIC